MLYLLVAGLVIFDYLKALVDLDLSHWDEVFEGEGCRAFTASYSDFLGRRYFTYCMTLGLLVSFFLLDSSGEAPLWLKEELESYPDPETGPVAAALMMIFVVFSAGSRVFRDLYYLARPELSLRDRVILSRLRGAQSSRDSDISKMLYSPKDWRSHEHKQGYFMSRLLLSSKRRFRRRFSEAENGRIVSAIDSLAGACRASLYSTASAEEFHVCSVYALALLSGRDPVDISNRVMNRFGGEEISSDYKGANVGHMLIAASDFLERINTLGKIVVLLAVAILLAWSGKFAELFDILKSIIGVS
ncbi:hypothetical protein [Saccharomonospora azurea]|uniref:hypothetical protein n=1 Tax=Saccharomonospora azurea TaxID=40988 RepID=UPI001147A2C0|nr:hypothetical protein [Saccharomonospora azurea]